MRLYINYQELNKIMIKNHYSLSLINETLDCIVEVTVFTKLNLRDIYYQFYI